MSTKHLSFTREARKRLFLFRHAPSTTAPFSFLSFA